MPRCPDCQEVVARSDDVCPYCEASLPSAGAESRAPGPPKRKRSSRSAPARRPARNKSGTDRQTLFIGLAVGGCVALIFVVGLIAVIASGSRPARDSATLRTQSKSNLRQLGVALHIYLDVHNALPPGGVYALDKTGHHGWQTSLLPYIEQAPLFDRIDFHQPWNSPQNQPAFKTVLNLYLIPGVKAQTDAGGYGLSHYAANSHLFGENSRTRIANIPDGMSNTIAAGEAAGNFQPWGHPANWRDPALGLNKGPGTFGRPTGQGAHLLIMDGTVRFVSDDVSPAVLRALATPNGSEDVSGMLER